MHTRGSRGRAAASWIVVSGAVLWLVSFALLLAISPSGTETSSDPGAQPMSYWATLTPLAAGIVLTLLLPGSSSASRPVAVGNRKSFTVTTTGLIVLAALLPLAAIVVPLTGESYILAKLLLFMIVPAMLVLTVRGSVNITWRANPSRWWAPLIVIVVWTLLSQIAPWAQPFDPSGMDTAFILTAAIATAITAGVGEELFYRRWLQTRLEALLGGWPGIVVTSLVFAFMHLGSHATGEPLLDVARVVVVQGTFGFFVGVMWWRYRNLTAIIVVHIISNGWAVAAALL